MWVFRSLSSILSRPLIIAVAAIFLFVTMSASCQTITVTPPSYPLTSLPYPDLYLNAASHWGRMAPQNTAGGFLPSVPLTRVVGLVHWPNIQPEASSSSWSSSLNGMGMNQSTGSGGANCSSISIATYWWPEASCFGSNGSYTASPNNILYTFYNVPAWASVSYGTFKDAAGSTVGWKVTNASPPSGSCTTKGAKCTLTLTISTSGNPGLMAGMKVLVNITTDGTNYSQYTVSPTFGTFGSNSQTLGITLGDVVAVPTTTNSYVSFTLSQPPSDIYSSGTCSLPDGNTSPNGDCYFKSFVTYLMMNSCKNTNGTFGVTVKTGGAPLGTCVIHYWEGWNEFNSDGFWTGDYTMLAKMMSDGEKIIKQYCNNCYFIAGSVTDGGDPGHYTTTIEKDVKDASTLYVQALGQLLKDWYNYNLQYGNTDTPDALSVHPYAGYDDIYMPAMPETREPVKFDPKLAGYTGIQSCTGTYTDSSGTVWGTPYGCVNICGETYSTSNGKYASTYNPVPALGCTEYTANPESSTYGTAWPGCGDFEYDGTTPNYNTLTIYQKDSDWTADPNPKLACRESFVNAIRSIKGLVSTMTTVLPTPDIPPGWVSNNLPVWNTESAQGSFGETNFVGANTNSPFYDPVDPSLTTFVQQAYIARMGILAAESGDALNLWYQWDENSTTTYPGPPVTYPAQFQVTGEPDAIQSFSNWGQLGNNFTTGSSSTNGTMQATRAAYTFNRIYHWLAGVTFNGTAPSGTWTGGHSYVINATIYDGVNVQRVVAAGTSGSSTPAWNGGLYGQTTDGSVVWADMGDKNCNDTSTFNTSAYPNNVTPAPFVCHITGSDGYAGTILWYTPFDQYATYPSPSGQTCLKDIDGNLKAVTAGSYHTILNRPAMYDSTPSSQCAGTDGLPE